MSGDATTYQAAGAAPLAAVLVNSSGTDDTLVSASSPYAKKVTLAPAEDGATPPATGCVASASVLPSASATPSENGHATPKPTGSPKRPAGTPGAHPSGSAAASSSAAPSGSAAPSDSASPSEPTGPSAIGLAVPSSSTVQLVSGCQQLVLSDLSQPVTPAMLVPVTLTFQNAGVVTLQLPFEPGDRTAPYARVRVRSRQRLIPLFSWLKAVCGAEVSALVKGVYCGGERPG